MSYHLLTVEYLNNLKFAPNDCSNRKEPVLISFLSVLIDVLDSMDPKYDHPRAPYT